MIRQWSCTKSWLLKPYIDDAMAISICIIAAKQCSSQKVNTAHASCTVCPKDVSNASQLLLRLRLSRVAIPPRDFRRAQRIFFTGLRGLSAYIKSNNIFFKEWKMAVAQSFSWDSKIWPVDRKRHVTYFSGHPVWHCHAAGKISGHFQFVTISNIS
jgi:hypothetical protein